MNRPAPPELTPEQKLFYKIEVSSNPFSRSSGAFLRPKTTLEQYIQRRINSRCVNDQKYLSGVEYGIQLAETYFTTRKSVEEYVGGLFYQVKKTHSDEKKTIETHKSRIKQQKNRVLKSGEKTTKRNCGDSKQPLALTIQKLRRLSNELTKSILKKTVKKFRRIDRKKSVSFNIKEKIHFPKDEVMKEKCSMSSRQKEVNGVSLRRKAEEIASNIIRNTIEKINRNRVCAEEVAGRVMINVKRHLVKSNFKRDIEGFRQLSEDIPSRDPSSPQKGVHCRHIQESGDFDLESSLSSSTDGMPGDDLMEHYMY